MLATAHVKLQLHACHLHLRSRRACCISAPQVADLNLSKAADAGSRLSVGGMNNPLWAGANFASEACLQVSPLPLPLLPLLLPLPLCIRPVPHHLTAVAQPHIDAAPEQLRDEQQHASKQTDVFAHAIIMWEVR